MMMMKMSSIEFDEELAKAELEQMRIICLHHLHHANSIVVLRHFIKVFDELRIYAESEIRRIKKENQDKIM